MKYVTPSGREFTLADHSLAEWAAIRYAALVHLGCSPAYAAADRDEILNARRPD